jgi:IclR family transcriptional regulator, acetate operon repressor
VTIGVVPDTSEPNRDSSQTVHRAIAVLNLFRNSAEPLGISAIARSTGLKLPTAHRLVRGLVAEGFMAQDPVSERYRLGPAIVVLAQQARTTSGLELVQPMIEQLAERCGESVSISTRHANTVLVVLRSATHTGLRFEHPAGGTIEIHASGMGKVLLAHSPDTLSKAVSRLGALQRFTPTTITDPAALISELEAVRVDGYATNNEERHAGVTGLAAPIPQQPVTYAIGIQGPTIRLTPERIQQLVPALREAASAISQIIT